MNASYLRLKNVEIGYNFDFPFMKKLKLTNCRMYVNGYNLLTFTNFKWGIRNLVRAIVLIIL